jgi:hypothetical protein
VLYDSGILEFTGTGNMYETTSTKPWKTYADSITEVVVNEGITSVSKESFSGCTELVSVSLPEELKFIGDDAFAGCGSLESIVIPEGVTRIGEEAFFGYALLSDITLPDTLETIENYAFWHCSSLASIQLPDSLETLEYGAFSTCESLTHLTIPAGVELRGAASVATRDQGWMSRGTQLLCYYGDEDGVDINGQAFITLAGKNAGVNGIRIIYPQNGPADRDLTTTYTVRGTAEGVYIVNSAIAASAYGVDFTDCDNHFIKKVSACCYYNTFKVGGKNGMIAGCLQNGTVLCRTSVKQLEDWIPEADVFKKLFDPITRRKNEFIIAHGAVGEQIFNTFVYGCASMIVCEADSSVLAVNIGSDNIGTSAPQIKMMDGELTVINSMRYNGRSYVHSGGSLSLYNRLTILNKNEPLYSESK